MKPRVFKCRNCPDVIPGWWALRGDEAYEFTSWYEAHRFALIMTRW